MMRSRSLQTAKLGILSPRKASRPLMTPKYQWTGTIECNLLEPWGLRDGAATEGRLAGDVPVTYPPCAQSVYNEFTKVLQRVYKGDWLCERFVAGYGWQLRWQQAPSCLCKVRCSPRPLIGARLTGKPSTLF